MGAIRQRFEPIATSKERVPDNRMPVETENLEFPAEPALSQHFAELDGIIDRPRPTFLLSSAFVFVIATVLTLGFLIYKGRLLPHVRSNVSHFVVRKTKRPRVQKPVPALAQQPSAAQPPAKLEHPPGDLAETVPKTLAETQPLKFQIPANPYLKMPNRIEFKAGETQVPINPESQSSPAVTSAANKLRNRYNYQHYLGTTLLRASHSHSALTPLTSALNEKKLWTRMQAAFAIAEIAGELAPNAMQQVFGTERHELIANYFERYRARNTAEERYVMREALRIAPTDARLVILNGLDRANDPLRDLVVVAATYDEAVTVRNWAQSALERHPIDDTKAHHAIALLSGQITEAKPKPNQPAGVMADWKPNSDVDDKGLTEKDIGEIEYYR